MSENNFSNDTIETAIIALSYTRGLSLYEAAFILAHHEEWPRYGIRYITELSEEWNDETGFYHYHHLNKALKLYRDEIKKGAPNELK